MTPSDQQDQQDNFARLIEHRAEIAEFVNSFTSERVQRKAFQAVVCSLGLAPQDAPKPSNVERLHIVQHEPEKSDADIVDDAGESDTGTQRRRRTKGSAKKSFTIPRGLNWAPAGHPTLEAFVAEKQPRNNNEKNLLACYFLTHMMEIAVDTEHVLAVYQAAGWDAPSHPHTSLQNTASTFGWIDTADMKAIKVVWQGENYLNSKMPVETKKKSG